METSQRPPGRNIDQRPHASPSFQMLAQTWKGFLQMRQVSTQGPKGPRSRQSALCHLLVFLLLSPPSDRTCRASEPPTRCHPRRFCCPHRHRRKRIYFHLRDQLPRRRPEGDRTGAQGRAKNTWKKRRHVLGEMLDISGGFWFFIRVLWTHSGLVREV